MKTEAEIYQALFDWLKDESGMTVIKADQKDPRPPRPYVSIKFLLGSMRVGSSMDQQTLDKVTIPGEGSDPDTFVYKVASEGMRKAIASINVFGDNALETLSHIRDSLDRADVIETFEVNEIGIIEDGQINDLTALQETKYEERAQMDLTISFVAGSEVDVGTIDQIEVEGHINGRTVSVESSAGG